MKNTILFSAKSRLAVPSRGDVIDALLAGGLISLSESPNLEYELAWKYLSDEERKRYHRNSEAGVSHCGIGVEVEVSPTPQMKVFANIQYLEGVTSPEGNTWGDLDIAYGYLASYHDDPLATAVDPASGSVYPIADLDFDRTVAFGRLFITMHSIRSRDECQLDRVSSLLGCPVRSCVNYG